MKLIGDVALLEGEDKPNNPEKWYRDRFGKEPDYSDILESLTNTPEERLNLIRPFIEPSDEEREQGLKAPTVAHRQIARLVKDGYIKVIITTNFDRLLENALKDEGIEPTVISNPNHIENAVPLIHSPITILKINGDYLNTSFLNIKSELTQYDPRLVESLKFIFENFGLVTCGWSAQWDIALVDIIKSASKFRYSTYLGHQNRITDEMNNLKAFRKAQPVQIKDADSFFLGLFEGVEALAKNGQQHPLTPTLLLQRVKKYLAKEEYRIELHDLFESITSDFLPKIAVARRNEPAITETVKEQVEHYKSGMRLLLMLMTQSGYWAEPYQHFILTNTLKRVAAEPDKFGIVSLTTWNQIVYLPALLLRYAVGIAAIANKKFQLVRDTLFLNMSNRYNLTKPIPIFKLVSVDQVATQGELKVIYGGGDLSVSTFIYKTLRPFFNELIPIDSDYQDAFHYYEFVSSLIYFENSTDNWAPSGLFIYADRDIVKTITERAEKELSNFELVKAGFYDSYDEFREEADRYQNFLQKRFR